VAARFVVAHPTALRPLEVEMEKRGIGVLDLVIASTDLASAQIRSRTLAPPAQLLSHRRPAQQLASLEATAVKFTGHHVG
jgi:hypothetical protein